MVDTAERPTADDLAEWLNVDPATAGLTDAIAAAIALQASHCRTDPYTVELRLAALRRGAREYVSRAFPMGYTDTPG